MRLISLSSGDSNDEIIDADYPPELGDSLKWSDLSKSAFGFFFWSSRLIWAVASSWRC